jgi:hypothetical protein
MKNLLPLKPMPLLLIGILLLLAEPSNAIPFSTNDRSSLLTEGSTSSEPSLADILSADGEYSGGFAQTDQSINALFTMVGEVSTELIIEIAGASSDNALGVYDLEGHEFILFDGSAGGGDSVNLIFGSGSVSIGRNGRINSTSEFGDTFGFFLRNEALGFTYYSQDILDPDGDAHFLAFEDGDGIYFGFEDQDLGDRDYNDLVAKVHGLAGSTPPEPPPGASMPEPTSALLFALGGLALYPGVVRRS